MNLLFISLLDFNSLEEHNIYTDILREFRKNNNKIYVISPIERRKYGETKVIYEYNCTILKLKIGNIQKTNILEKGVSTLLISKQLINGIKRYFSEIKFDLILYPTPPITIVDTVSFVKKRDNAKTYLLLKDIFPQNAVDIGIMSKSGFGGLFYRYFRDKERKLYRISDKIGCMSQANIDYVIKHNPEINSSKLEICPNCIEPQDMSISPEERNELRRKYNIPLDKTVFVYGGNLGKPQGIPFIMECLKKQKENSDAYFLIVGDGTEFEKLQEFFNTERPENMKLMSKLPKDDYDRMVAACDVGLIFLDYRFTIPNFPSRLLNFMQAKLPVLVATDPNTDMGQIVIDNGFGWSCLSNDSHAFIDCVREALQSNLKIMGETSRKFLENHYDVKNGYTIIANHLKDIY